MNGINKIYHAGVQTEKWQETYIYIYISHNSKKKYIPTEYFILSEYFDNGNIDVLNYPINDIDTPEFLDDLELKLRNIKKSFTKQVRDMLGNSATFNLEQLIKLIDFEPKEEKKNEEPVFYEYFKKIIERKTKVNSRTGEIYQGTLDKLEKYLNNIKTLPFSRIDYSFLVDFDYFMRNEKMKTNSRSIEMRNIRHVFNCARNIDEIIPFDMYPFRKYKIERDDDTDFIYLEPEVLKKIRDFNFEGLKLDGHNKRFVKSLEETRDFFMLSFYLIGTNIVDIVHLEEIKKGYIKYRRRKTKRLYDIKLEPEMEYYIDRYKGKDRLFSFSEGMEDYRSFTKKVNDYLKELADLLEIDDRLTTYYARYSWAEYAENRLNISRDVVRSALGHGKKEVTDTYVKRNQEKIDSANRKVLDFMK